jgi:hypothetical protein
MDQYKSTTNRNAIISRSSAAISGSISESNSIIGVVEGIHIDDYMLV